MNPIEQLLEDARLALETLELCHDRADAKGHAVSSAEWLEQTARKIREQLVKPATAEVPS